jgi:hypothetical protein
MSTINKRREKVSERADFSYKRKKSLHSFILQLHPADLQLHRLSFSQDVWLA